MKKFYRYLIPIIPLFLSGCTSTRHITESTCTAASQSISCQNRCASISDDSRPLWCYRLFCVHGSPIYGSWCNGMDGAILPTEENINEIKADHRYQLLTGSFSEKDKINDNGLAFLMALSQKTAVVQKNVSVSVVGESALPYRSDVNSERFYLSTLKGKTGIKAVKDNSTDLLQDNFSNDTTPNHLSPKRSDFVTIGTEFEIAGGGTALLSRITGNNNYDILGAASSYIKLKTYNPFDFVIFNRDVNKERFKIGDDITGTGQGQVANIKDYNTKGGSYYRFLSEKINASIENILPEKSTNKSEFNIVTFGFEGYRDGRQLADGFDILRTTTHSIKGTDGLFGDKGENNVSFALVNAIAKLPSGGNKKSDSFLNPTFASGLQMLYGQCDANGNCNGVTGNGQFYRNQGNNYKKKMKGTNEFTIDNLVSVSRNIGEKLGEFKNTIFVVSPGYSSVNNTGGSAKLFYEDPSKEVPDVNSSDSWDHQRPWYLGSNLYQTNGMVDDKIYLAHPNGDFKHGNFFIPNYVFGNSPQKNNKVGVFDTNGKVKDTESNIVADQSIGNTDMRFTGQYPSAFLQHLWVNDYYSAKNGKDVKDWNVYRMDPRLAFSNWNEIGGNVLTYSKGSSNPYIKVHAQFLLGKGYHDGAGHDIPAYANSDAYRYLVAGAFDSSTDNGLGSLVAYTNAAGALKYNYLLVNVNSKQHNLVDDLNNSNEEGFHDYNKKKGRAVYHVSPGLSAAAMLTGYVQRLKSIFEKASGNDIAFVLRHTADQIYGRSFTKHLDKENKDVEVNQGTFYFTHEMKDDLDPNNMTDEQNSLLQLNKQANRDVFIFEGVSKSQEQDGMFRQMFDKTGGSNNGNGIAHLTPKMIAPDLFGEGHITNSGSFFVGNGVWHYDKASHMLTTKVGDNTYKRSRAAFQWLNRNGQGGKAGDEMDENYINNELKKLNKEHNIDPNTRVDTGGRKANSFMTIDLGSKAHVKFNWESQPRTYYDMDFLGCAAGVSCTQKDYQKYLKQYYDQKGTPENEREVVDLNVDSNGNVTLCDPASGKCSYKFEDGGYNNIHLGRFNEHRNVLLVAVEDEQGTRNYAGKKVKMEVLVLDPAIVAKGDPSKGQLAPNVDKEFEYFHKLNDVIDGKGHTGSAASWGDKLKSLGIEDIKEARISNDCLSSLHCTHHDLWIMFKLRPDLFDKAPSNVYGQGNIDAVSAHRELTHAEKTFYNGIEGQLSRELQQFFYNKDCHSSNCGVSLTNELGFVYTPGIHNPDTNADGSDKPRINSGHNFKIHTPYGDKYLTVKDIEDAVNYVDGNAGFNLGFIMGAVGPATGMNNTMSFATRNTRSGSQFSLNAPSMVTSAMIGGKNINSMEFTNQVITNVDRNTDQFGYAAGMGTAAIGMLTGVRFNQSLGDNMELKTMFFGNKNEHDLINTNKIGALLGSSSIYMLTMNQQGMFSNPYLKISGGYSGSIYSLTGNVTANLKYRFSSVQTFNPISNMLNTANGVNPLGHNGKGLPFGSFGSFGFGASSENSLQELQILYNGKNNSSYSVSVGMANEHDSLFGSNVLPGGIARTNYFDAKIIQGIGKGFYLMGHYNIGLIDVQERAGLSVFHDFHNLTAQKYSFGIVKENILGGSLFFTYTETNRLISGMADISDSTGDVGSVNFAKFIPERNYEIGYLFAKNNWRCSFSTMLRTYMLSNQILFDGVAMVRLNTSF